MSKTQTDSVATQDAQGNLSNSRLHEQMVEGVNDQQFVRETRRKLEAKGTPKHVLDAVLPET